MIVVKEVYPNAVDAKGAEILDYDTLFCLLHDRWFKRRYDSLEKVIHFLIL